jgi:diguanylate cyclase (GGDEF)-like protein/PAS domain S-box-containing protein
MKTQPASSHKTQLAFGTAILALLMVGAISLRGIAVSHRSEEWVRHTHQVLEHLQSLLIAMQGVETSARGFILTGKESYLETYRTEIVNSTQEEMIVRDLTVDNPNQQRRIPELEKLGAQRIHLVQSVIDVRQMKGLDAAVEAAQRGDGQQIVEDYRALIHTMQDEELRLLALRNADAARRLNQTRNFLLLGTLLGVLIASAAALGAQRDNVARARAEIALREGEERFRTMANNITQLAWMADETGYIFWYNDRWFDYTGTTLEEAAGWGGQTTVHPDHVDRVMSKIKHSFQIGEAWEDNFPLRGKDGEYREFLSRAVPIRDAQGKVVRWFGTNTDVSERQAMEDALFTEKERAQVTLNSIGDAVICTDIAGNVSFLNPVAEKITGWTAANAVGRPMREVAQILDGATGEPIPNPMELAVAENRTMSLPENSHLMQRNGLATPIEDSVSPIHDRKGQISGAVIVFRDVSVARAMALQMAHSAQHDFLTGLPNRMLLNDRINQAIVLAPRHSKKVAVLFLDLDGFKHINDSLGHLTGDKLLQSIATRLEDCVRGSDTVSRQGGDEFVVLLSEIDKSEDAALTAARILQAVAEAHFIDQHDLHVTTSIGVSVYPDDGVNAETLIKNADTAMYQAKENGHQSYQFFKTAMNVRAVGRQSIEESLRRALEREEFTLHYQPKVDLRTGEITGAEALLRWTHPTRGLVSPAEFIPVAEECGLILPIGRWALCTACKQAQEWMKADLPLRTMAVNISAMEFRDDHFLEGVFAILKDTGLDAKFLELELTESVLMKHAEATQAILRTFRSSGVQIAVDDFGTGYSSLSYLRKFPIDALKIDQSFIHQITTVPDETTIVAAVIAMGRSLKLRLVAEGVETQEELDFLQAHSCNEAQGYFFSRPVAAEEFAQLLKTGVSQTVLR